MTGQQLIDLLEQLPDKSLPVKYQGGYGEYVEVKNVEHTRMFTAIPITVDQSELFITLI